MTLIGSGTITRKLVGSATLGTLAPTTTGGIEIDLLEGGDSASVFGGESPATVQITVRKDTYDNWVANNPILGESEIAHITDTNQYIIGNGVDAFQDLPTTNYLASMDDLMMQIGNVSGSLAEIQSDISTLQTDLGLAETSIAGLTTSVSSLQTSVNNHESDITDLQSTVSTLQTDLTSSVSGLQGQIDDLSGGVMKKYTLQFNASDVPSVEGSPFDIITPTTGTTLVFIAACVSVTAKSPSTKRLNFEFNNDATYGNPINTINITDDINGTTNALIGNSKPFMTIDQTLQLTLINSGVQSGNAQFTLTIFYMEV